MSKPTVTSVQAQIDTHEAVCSERWKETILRIKRIEHTMIGTAGTGKSRTVRSFVGAKRSIVKNWCYILFNHTCRVLPTWPCQIFHFQ